MYHPLPHSTAPTRTPKPHHRATNHRNIPNPTRTAPIITQVITLIASLCLLLTAGCKSDNQAVTILKLKLDPQLLEAGVNPVHTLRLWYKIELPNGERLTGNPDGNPLNISLAEPLNNKTHTLALKTMKVVDENLALHIVGLGMNGKAHAHWSGLLPINQGKTRTIHLVGWNETCDNDGDLFQDCTRSECCPTLQEPHLRAMFNDCLDSADDVTRQATFLVDPPETVARLSHPFRSTRFESGDSVFCQDGLDNNCNGQIDPLCDFIDADQDGWDSKRDCDDNDPNTYPGAPEICDGVDNNCNGLIDHEDPALEVNQPCELQAGVCQGAMKPASLCQNGVWQPCTDEHYAAHDPAYGEEICDGLDNNCNGLFDSADPAMILDQQCENQTGVCEHSLKPAHLCGPGGTWLPCTDAEYEAHAPDTYGREVCDGLDNSCNDLIDSQDPDMLLDLCDNQKGVCQGAMRTAELCVGGEWEPCTKQHYTAHAPTLYGEELCDGLDNNCSGFVDAEDEALVVPLCENQRGVCSGARKAPGLCQNGEWQPCNEQNYQNHHPAYGLEVCDGLDNNCSGQTDARDEALVLPLCENQLGVCKNSRKTASLCRNGAWQPCTETLYRNHHSAYGPEVCDGLDNNCSGFVDALDDTLTLPLCENQRGVCRNSRKAPTLCHNGEWMPCGEADYQNHHTSYGFEVCDNLDNDCDGSVDNVPGVGNPCPTGIPGACSSGELSCHGSQDMELVCQQTVFPTAEKCNGQDLDCDGIPNNPTGYCNTGEHGICRDGERTCDIPNPLDPEAPGCRQLNYPRTERCNGLDDNCDGIVDNVDGAGEPCPTGIPGACAMGRLACQGTELACQQTVFPVAEKCNGQDLNCDGIPNNPSGLCLTGKEGICAYGELTCDIVNPWDPEAPGCRQLNEPRTEQCNGLDDDCDGIVDNPTGTCDYPGTLSECYEAALSCEGATSLTPICVASPVEDGAPCGSSPTHQCFMGECIDVPPDWSPIAPGTFTMGSKFTETGRNTEETEHQVTITRPFMIKTTQVTNEEWKAMVPGTNPSRFQATCTTNCPVERINWYEALEYLNRLSEQEGLQKCYDLFNCSQESRLGYGCDSGFMGRPTESCSQNTWVCSSVTFTGLDCTGYRLPTEAEWEYAARAGSTTAFHNGATNPAQIGWYSYNSNNRTHSVQQKTPNAWGLYDVHGNVWEFTWDNRRRYSYTPITDPFASNTQGIRVVRGGAWYEETSRCRAASRAEVEKNFRHQGVGFRPVRTIQMPAP